MADKLEGPARDAALAELTGNGWALQNDRDAIRKVYKFDTFAQAFGWMTKIAIEADKMDHHPEWFNVYNRVEVILTTHNALGLTDLDLTLARKMDA